MPKIKNLNYRDFIDKGLIQILSYQSLKDAIKKVDGINGKYVKEGRALLIALYYTGGRPVEVLDLRGEQITRQDSYVVIKMQAAKRGLNRPIYLPYRFAAVKELYNYAMSLFPGALMFYHYRSNNKKEITMKSGEVKVYTITTDNLYYHIKKWFKGVLEKGTINPYYLRHNRFSQLSEQGLSPEELRQLKGSKTLESVLPYLHLSGRTAKKIARHIK